MFKNEDIYLIFNHFFYDLFEHNLLVVCDKE